MIFNSCIKTSSFRQTKITWRSGRIYYITELLHSITQSSGRCWKLSQKQTSWSTTWLWPLFVSGWPFKNQVRNLPSALPLQDLNNLMPWFKPGLQLVPTWDGGEMKGQSDKVREVMGWDGQFKTTADPEPPQCGVWGNSSSTRTAILTQAPFPFAFVLH